MADDPMQRTDTTEPGTYVYTVERARRGYRLNELSMSMTEPENRDAFRADEEAYMDRFGLSEEEKEMVRKRDWKAMIEHGGSIYLIIKIAGALGQNLIDMGAQMRGESFDDFMATRPYDGPGVSDREALR